MTPSEIDALAAQVFRRQSATLALRVVPGVGRGAGLFSAEVTASGMVVPLAVATVVRRLDAFDPTDPHVRINFTNPAALREAVKRMVDEVMAWTRPVPGVRALSGNLPSTDPGRCTAEQAERCGRAVAWVLAALDLVQLDALALLQRFDALTAHDPNHRALRGMLAAYLLGHADTLEGLPWLQSKAGLGSLLVLLQNAPARLSDDVKAKLAAVPPVFLPPGPSKSEAEAQVKSLMRGLLAPAPTNEPPSAA